MWRVKKDLEGLKLAARDGEIGKVKDVYFDDHSWAVRYLVADTGNWLTGQLVLISPHSIKGIQAKAVEVDLTRHQIEDAPPIAADVPVSRQFEAEYYQYYNWPIYWEGAWAWEAAPYPGPYRPDLMPPAPPARNAHKGDPHLRGSNEVSHYQIQALDHKIGHVADFCVDELDWAIRYLEVDTRQWLPGKHVLLPPMWISWVSWPESQVYVDLDRETIKRAPEYDPSCPISREYETRLFQHYGREPYWSRAQPAPGASRR